MKCCLLLLLILGLASCDRNPTPVQATVGDTYPGDAAYTRKVLELLNSVRNNRMHLPWAGNRTLSRRDFCLELVNRHFSGTSQGQGQTCARWQSCPDLNQDTLLAACEQALD